MKGAGAGMFLSLLNGTIETEGVLKPVNTQC